MKYIWLLTGRLAFWVVYPFRKLVFWHPYFKAPRVRVALKAPDGEVLVVRTWFGLQRWSLPGGGIDTEETEQQAAVREVHEETGISIQEQDLAFVGEVQLDEAPHVTLRMYEAMVASKELQTLSPFHRLEITDRRWWQPSQSLENPSSSVQWYRDYHNR